ncbi:hypothetical protein CUPS4256_03995 [Campylobacter upsaliensis]|nr:hypothetical protein [Campylobacter upsaliensis]
MGASGARILTSYQW